MSLTAEEIRECTMIALDQPPWWPEDSGNPYVFKFTIYIDGSNILPLNYNGPLIELKRGIVNWGDGEEEEYQNIMRDNIYHEYSSPGTYQITIESERKYSSFTYCSFSNDLSIISIDTPIPMSSFEEEYSYDPSTQKYIGPIYYYLNNFNFNACKNLKSIPDDFFKYVKKIWKTPIIINEIGKEVPYENASMSMRGTANFQFSNCILLENIPVDLYKDTGVSEALGCFSGCSSLKSYIGDIFFGCEYLTIVESCFSDCILLSLLSSDMFYKCKSLRLLDTCFSGCESLEFIPENIFKNIGNDDTFSPAFGYSFQGCFNNCTALKTLPNGLFKDLKQNKAIRFNACFNGCLSLISIPSDMFSNCYGATNFAFCFDGCSSLGTIPSGLFDDCINADIFYACFDVCSSLTSIPYALFDNCNNVTSFERCFRNCNSVTSDVPPLWVTHGNADHYLCFFGCYNASNYDSIPSSWRRR